MRTPAFSVCVLILSMLEQVSGNLSVVGKYGESIVVPCNKGDIKLENILIVKWKYTKVDGSVGDILTKSQTQDVSFSKVVYQERIMLTEDLSLQISNTTMDDQMKFTCLVVAGTDIHEYSVQVTIWKAPTPPIITDQAKVIELGRPTVLAQCSTKDASPAADIIWKKDNIFQLTNDEKVTITSNVQMDTDTGLSSTFSKLEYTATKADLNSAFICAVMHENLDVELVSVPMTFIIHYPSEKVSLQVVSGVPIKEGDNVTLKCAADGNPPPTNYTFHIKNNVITENSDTYTLTSVTQADSGEYKCSLVDDESKTGSTNVTVMYLDITHATTGKLVKKVSESFEAMLVVSAPEHVQDIWTKNNVKLDGKPKFDKLEYSDSGVYECVVSLAGLVKKASFELSVQGTPVIIELVTENRNGDRILKCKAEGSPKPVVQWSTNGTDASESYFVDGVVTYSLTLSSPGNLTVNCTVSNELGSYTKSIDISTSVEETPVRKREGQMEDSKGQSPAVVGVVIGLILAVVAIGLACWIYKKRNREGTWKTQEKENGTLEESKKLEETQSQKADV